MNGHPKIHAVYPDKYNPRGLFLSKNCARVFWILLAVIRRKKLKSAKYSPDGLFVSVLTSHFIGCFLVGILLLIRKVTLFVFF